jgi:predicted HicB family RNase H-like nuclease
MLKTETLNLRVSVEFKRQLVEEARKEKRSVTNYIEAAITDIWSKKGSGTVRTKIKRGE